MATSLSSTCLLGFPFLKHFSSFTPLTDKWNSLRLNKTTCSTSSTSVFTTSSNGGSYEKSKRVWIWTESKQVMTAAVERGWNTFIFLSNHRQLAIDWSSIALIYPLFIEEGEVLDGENKRVATIFEVSTPQELQQLQPENGQAENVVINLLDWQIIPAENIVATFQGSRKTVLAISKNHSEAQIFLEALEHGLGGVVLKVEDVEAVIKLKEYFDRRNEATNLISLTKATVTRVQVAGMGDRICVDICSLMKPGEGLLALEHGLGGVVLKVEGVEAVIKFKEYFDRRNEATSLISLTKATVTRVQAAGMGDRICVDLCSLMKPGEGLLVGSFARGLFLVHSECMESNYIASRPFRINAGPVHAYVSIPGGRTCYLSELKAGKEISVADQNGQLRTAIVGRVKIETRPLILVEAKRESDDQTVYSIFLQNAETVALVPPCEGKGLLKAAIPVTSLKVGDEVLLRIQGGARHTGIEIQEFIVEN